MIRQYSGILTSLLFLVCSDIAEAKDDSTYTYNVWTTNGQTRWRHDASALDAHFGVPTSELDYQNVRSQVGEISLIHTKPNGDQLQFIAGAGMIDSGTLVDDDYLSASGATYYGTTVTGAHRFSRTHSDIEGDGLFYIGVNFLPYKIATHRQRLNIQSDIGVQYWREEYHATGIQQIECTSFTHPDLRCSPAGTVSHTGITVISNKVEWTGLGLGIRADISYLKPLQFEFAFKYYPLMYLNNEDTHHLRTDLAQDPSIQMTGRGTGYDLMLGLKLTLTRQSYIHLGYQVWEREVSNATIAFYGSSGGASTAELMNFKTRREGIIGGLGLSF